MFTEKVFNVWKRYQEKKINEKVSGGKSTLCNPIPGKKHSVCNKRVIQITKRDKSKKKKEED